MNVTVVMSVMVMQLAPMLMEVTPVPAKMDLQGTVSLAQVSIRASRFLTATKFRKCYHIITLQLDLNWELKYKIISSQRNKVLLT